MSGFVTTGLQPTTTMGEEDPNGPAVPTAARVQGYSYTAETWRSICYYNPDDPPLNPCGLAVGIVNANPIPVEVVTGGGTALAAQTAVGPNDVGLAVRMVNEADISAIRTFTSSIDTKTPALGPAVMAGSVPIVFATNHPPVAAELYVGGSPLSNANAVPVRGAIPATTGRGTPTAATGGTILNAAGALLRIRMSYTGGGMNHYLQLFDATDADTLTTALLMPGYTYPLGVTIPDSQEVFTYGLQFTAGIRWAISDTKHTYTASAETAIVTAQWAPGAF